MISAAHELLSVRKLKPRSFVFLPLTPSLAGWLGGRAIDGVSTHDFDGSRLHKVLA